MKEFVKKYKYELILIGIAALTYAAYLIISGIYPFGKNSLIAGDIAGQYYEYWAYMKNAILGKQSIIYSFGKSIGGSMIGIWAYYLLSPYNILFIFFSEQHFAEVLMVIIGLKIITSAVTCYEYLKRQSNNKYLNIILSMSYALCGFVVAFQMNVMWLDGIIFLPIVCMAIDKILEGKKPNLYIISLSLAIITNFYIGFSICIFVAIYYVYKYLVTYKKEKINITIKNLLKFALYSIIAVAIACIVIIPVYYMLSNGKGSNLTISFKDIYEANFGYLDVLGKFLPGAINNQEIFYGLPNLYSGLFTLFLVAIFFCNSQIKPKEKIMAVFLLIFMIFMMHNKLINLIWHGLKEPTGFPYRYSFVFSFIMVMLAGKVNKIKIKDIIISSILILMLIVFCTVKKYEYLSISAIYISLFLIIAYSVILGIISKKEKNILYYILIIITVSELLYNYCITYKNIDYLQREPYASSVKEYEQIFKQVQNQDTSFYRMEKIGNFYLNDSLLCNYNGVGHSSSTFDANVTNLLKQIGYNYYMDWPSYGTGDTLITDMLFNIKYKVSKYDRTEGFEYKNKIDNENLFQNKYNLEVGYISDGYVKKVEDLDDPFKLQENMLNQLLNSENTYFKNIESNNLKLNNIIQEKNEYQKVDEDSFIELEYDLSNVQNNNLYFYIKSSYYSDMPGVKIYVNDQYFDLYLGSNKMGVLNINRGAFNIKDTLNIKIYMNADEKVNIDDYSLKVLDYDKLDESYNLLKENQLQNIKFSNNTLTGNITVTKSGYLSTSIPYEKEWSIFVDGNKVNPKEDAEFIVVELDEGQHNIEFKYHGKGLKIGIIISALGLIALILLNIVTRKK